MSFRLLKIRNVLEPATPALRQTEEARFEGSTT
jgi:hypothetical protein